MKLAIGIYLTLASALGLAAEVKVEGRDYSYSCGYFTSMVGDYRLYLRDTGLPWGTKVTTVTGWSGQVAYGSQFEWEHRREVPAQAVAPYVWRADVSGTLAQRSSPWRRTGLDFVFKVELPTGQVRWINGGDSWSFFKVGIGGSSAGNCIRHDDEKPGFRPIPYQTIRRN